jgi:hypothetical protein
MMFHNMSMAGYAPSYTGTKHIPLKTPPLFGFFARGKISARSKTELWENAD